MVVLQVFFPQPELKLSESNAPPSPDAPDNSLHPNHPNPKLSEPDAPPSHTALNLSTSHACAQSSRPKAWIFSDKAAVRQDILSSLNFYTVKIHHDLHSRGQAELLLQRLKTSRPDVLWCRLAGPCAGTGNKNNSRRTENLVRLIRSQLLAKQVVVLEANDRSQVWNMISRFVS